VISVSLTEARTVSDDCPEADVPRKRRRKKAGANHPSGLVLLKPIPREDWKNIFN
jgi:hypothetical protein